MSPWFASAVAEARGLLLPGRPRGHTASILLAPDRVSIWAGDAFAHLSWDDHGPGRSWRITWSFGGGGRSGGIAMGVGGDAVEAMTPVRAGTNTFLTRADRGDRHGVVVPLRVLGSSWLVEAEHDTLSALCTHLAQDPTIRPGLADPNGCGSSYGTWRWEHVEVGDGPPGCGGRRSRWSPRCADRGGDMNSNPWWAAFLVLLDLSHTSGRGTWEASFLGARMQ